MKEMNVKPIFLKIMKQKIFTLIMMLALVIMTGSAYALNDIAPLKGGTYPYHVGSIAVIGGTGIAVATATITYSGDQGTPTPSTVALTSDSTSLTFRVAYGSAATEGDLKVEIKYDAGGGCGNYILLHITPANPPVWDLTITSNATGDDYGCQHAVASPLTNGTADAYAGGNNSITFTVAAGSPPLGSPTFKYDITASSVAFDETCTTCGSNKTAGAAYAVTFPSLEGAGGTVVGTIDNATFKMDAAHGGGTYNMNVIGSAKTVAVSPLPTIGAFN
jgi:hypothetical protein